MLKHLLPFMVSALLSISSFAQTPSIPQDYTLDSDEDYAPYHQSVVELTNWLESTPMDENVEQRNEAIKFVFTWVQGSPDVSVILNAELIPFTEKNPDLIFTYLFRQAAYLIEHPEEKDMVKVQKLALESCISVYLENLGKGIVKDKAMNKIIKMRDKGTMEAWIESKLQ